MKIEVLYKNHCYEEFDSTTQTNADPYHQGCNVLTDWILHLDDLEHTGIILVQHWYDKKANSDNVLLDGAQVPVATRNLGCAMLLVAANELDDIVWLKKDGEKLLWREGDDLINGERFFAMEQLCYSDSSVKSINKRALAVFDYLTNAHPERNRTEIARSMGYTMSAIDRITDAEIAQIKELDEYSDDTTESDDTENLIIDGDFDFS